jgi:hypothetical protein
LRKTTPENRTPSAAHGAETAAPGAAMRHKMPWCRVAKKNRFAAATKLVSPTFLFACFTFLLSTAGMIVSAAIVA